MDTGCFYGLYCFYLNFYAEYMELLIFMDELEKLVL